MRGVLSKAEVPMPMPSNQGDIKSSHYLDVLARKVSELTALPDEILHAAKIREIRADPVRLAEFIDGKPHLQEQLAYLTDFTPSQWLLAQEIPAIRKRRYFLQDTDYNFDPDKHDPYQ